MVTMPTSSPSSITGNRRMAFSRIRSTAAEALSSLRTIEAFETLRGIRIREPKAEAPPAPAEVTT